MRYPPRMWGRRNTGDAISLEMESLDALQFEVLQGRRKFPANRLMLAGAIEELGELAQALLQRRPREQIEREALQVAAVAMRIYEEGDATFADVTDEEAQP
jgi:hypothetical protein